MSTQAVAEAKKEKRRVSLLIAALLGTAYLVYLISYFLGTVNAPSTDSATQAGGLIATALVTPHIICVALSVVFGWLAWTLKMAGFALVAGILYCVAGVIFLMYFPFVIIQMILSFVGYAKTKKAKKA